MAFATIEKISWSLYYVLKAQQNAWLIYVPQMFVKWVSDWKDQWMNEWMMSDRNAINFM